MITTIKRLLARLFVQHQWIRSDDMRTCKVCGQRDENCGDDWGTFWVPTRKGDPAKHGGAK